jgi:hypothetical protein
MVPVGISVPSPTGLGYVLVALVARVILGS